MIKVQVELDLIDHQIIFATQAGLPLVSRPYEKIASELSLSEEEVFARIQRMKKEGFIRKIAGTPNHYKIGYVANAMTVWDVPDDKVDIVGEIFKSVGFISHCYIRPRALPAWPYNLFAMVHGHNKNEVEEQIHLLKSKIKNYFIASQVLYSTKILKKTGIRFKRNDYV